MAAADDTATTAGGELAEGDAWMTTDEVADEWGRNVETVRRWIRNGHLPAHRTPGGRTLLVKRSDVVKSLERGRAGGERRPAAVDTAESRTLADRTVLLG
jgi:excisionase family DNA binding protein